MSDEYFDGEEIRIISCARCGETRVNKFPSFQKNRKSGLLLCNLCLNNELTEKLIELLEKAERREITK